MRDLETCQHEASHVVVGVHLGLRLRKVSVEDGSPMWCSGGYAWFTRAGSDLAHAIMFAAGVAWEEATGNPDDATEDAALCFEKLSGANDKEKTANFRTCVKIAKNILKSHKSAHKQVTMALLEKDLTARHISAIARGEKVTDVE